MGVYNRWGRLAGSVVASRLYEKNNGFKILLVEAGPDVSAREGRSRADDAGNLVRSE